MNLLSARDISFTYKRGVYALRTINIEISKGDIIGLVGPIGAGKTTLMRILSGVYTANSGAIVRQDRNPISYLPASQGLSELLTVRENLTMWRLAYGISTSRVQTVIEQMHLKNLLNKQVSQLSSGMKQKAAIAVSCLLESGIYIFDEPFVNMDYDHCKIACDILTENKEDKGILISSHNLDYIDEICNKIIFLKKGNVAKVLDKYTYTGASNLKRMYDSIINGGASYGSLAI